VSPAVPGRRRPARVAGLLLAAGAGTRFGGPKAVAELDGERLVDRAVRVLRVGGCDPVLVVLGAAVVDVPGADTVVENADWSSGMGSSLRTGLASPALTGCSAVVVLLVDQPGVKGEAVRALLAAHDAGAELAVASYPEGTGHPVLIGRGHWPGVRELAVGDTGARPYLAAHAADVVEVDCTGRGDALDADTPQELTGRGVLSRIAGDSSAAGGGFGGLAAGMGELGALLGGAGARAALEEKAAQEVRRETQEAGEPAFEVDLDSGVVRLRRPEAPPQ
jgi:CTP:molybdopterin cytidylyltransferase MocA